MLEQPVNVLSGQRNQQAMNTSLTLWVHILINNKTIIMNVKLIIAGEENYAGFCDKFGDKIYIGNRLEFYDYSGAVWRGNVEYDDGIITVSILDLEQVKNPKDWKQNHDWIKSRHCSCTIGYSEFGSWNSNRKQLSGITGMFKVYDEYKKVQDMFTKKYKCYSHEQLFRPLPCLLIK